MAVSGIAIFASKLQNRPVCLPQVAKMTQHDYIVSLGSSWEANAGFPPSQSQKSNNPLLTCSRCGFCASPKTFSKQHAPAVCIMLGAMEDASEETSVGSMVAAS